MGVIRVLIVDDSAYVRKVLKEILLRSPFVQVVGMARDGNDALDQAAMLKPDVITLDLIMPQMDGITFLHEQMARHPIPVVVVSIASESGELALNALEVGAVDFVQKPTALATDKVYEISDELIAKVKAASKMRPPRRLEPKPIAPVHLIAKSERVDSVVIGISTGGPQALRYMIPQLPADFPVPIAIVLHMPMGYTELYAQKLGEISKRQVTEAKEGDPLRAGTILIAPAGRHLILRRNGQGDVVAHLDVQPVNTLHRPAVDVLLQSAAEVYGSRILGVVMTGIGVDGKEGSAWIKSRGYRLCRGGVLLRSVRNAPSGC